MGDVFTKAQRSAVMARVRSRDNASTEMRTVGLLREAGITGWRRHLRIFGSPDFVFREARIALFVDGCFWHGCPRCKRIPASSAAFWAAKIQRNMQRDRKVSYQLRRNGWNVLRVRECQLKMPLRFLNRLKALLSVGNWQVEEIKKNLKQADRGAFASDEEVAETIRHLTIPRNRKISPHS